MGHKITGSRAGYWIWASGFKSQGFGSHWVHTEGSKLQALVYIGILLKPPPANLRGVPTVAEA